MKKILIFVSFSALVACSSDQTAFEFTDYSKCENDSGERTFARGSLNSSWDGTYINAVVETNLNCAQTPQKPNYQIKDNVLVLGFETISAEGGSALCECGHRVEFSIRSEKELPVKVLFNGVEFRPL